MTESRCLSCGEPIAGRDGRGRPRVYCSHACRTRAWRLRKAADELGRELVPAAPAAPIAQAPVKPVRFAHPDEQVAAAVLEGYRVAGALLRLGRDARPALAWRCEKIGEALREALVEHFGEL